MVTEIQNFWEKYVNFFYDTDLFKSYGKLKKILQQNSSIFRFYVWILNFVQFDSLCSILQYYHGMGADRKIETTTKVSL